MEHVILIHGFGSHGLTMSLMRTYIMRYSNYNVICPTYQSLFFSSIETIGANVVEQINKCVKSGDTIHFIGHSLGGIIAKFICNSILLVQGVKIGHIVTLGTPHNGTLLATRVLKKFPILKYISPIVPQLTKDSHTIRNIRHPETKIGVIVGTKNSHIFNPVVYLGGLFLKDINSHDGVVEMESNLITKATSLIMLHVNHVEMLWSTELFHHSLNFIKHGVFH